VNLLSDDIKNKKAIINLQNSDRQCFKWAILAIYVSGNPENQVAKNYTSLEYKYNFTDLTFSTPITEIKILEKNVLNTSVNVFGTKQENNKTILFIHLKLWMMKKKHFDLMLITERDKSHYTFISNCSRLVRAHKTSHDGHIIFCERCFTSHRSIVDFGKIY